MLVRNLSKRGGPWEQKVHIILDQKMDLSIYEVITEGRKGKSRILHRIFCCLVTSCKVPKRREGQSLLLKKERNISRVVTVESYLVS